MAEEIETKMMKSDKPGYEAILQSKGKDWVRLEYATKDRFKQLHEDVTIMIDRLLQDKVRLKKEIEKLNLPELKKDLKEFMRLRDEAKAYDKLLPLQHGFEQTEDLLKLKQKEKKDLENVIPELKR